RPLPNRDNIVLSRRGGEIEGCRVCQTLDSAVAQASRGDVFVIHEWTLFKSPIEGEPLFTYSPSIYQPLIVDNPIDGRVGAMPRQPVANDFFDSSVPYPMWKTPVKIDPRTTENFLFNRREDPDQLNNLWHSETAVRDALLATLKTRLIEEGCPPEQFVRLGLDAS
ncbi:MAG: hypothetical protein AAF499_13560, partial [Pseudomonadota bacterium]